MVIYNGKATLKLIFYEKKNKIIIITNKDKDLFKYMSKKDFHEMSKIVHSGNSGQNGGILDTEMCTLTNWSEWSSCSATCGLAVKSRSRNFKHKQYRKQCRNIPNGPELEQTIECDTEPCSGEDGDEVRNQLGEENNENPEDDENNSSYEGDDPEVEVIEEWSQVRKFQASIIEKKM